MRTTMLALAFVFSAGCLTNPTYDAASRDQQAAFDQAAEQARRSSDDWDARNAAALDQQIVQQQQASQSVDDSLAASAQAQSRAIEQSINDESAAIMSSP